MPFRIVSTFAMGKPSEFLAISFSYYVTSISLGLFSVFSSKIRDPTLSVSTCSLGAFFLMGLYFGNLTPGSVGPSYSIGPFDLTNRSLPAKSVVSLAFPFYPEAINGLFFGFY